MDTCSTLFLLNSTNHSTHNSEIAEEELVEKYFQQTTTKGSSGQFIVRLALKNHPTSLGNTSMMAKRFLSLEKRLSGDSTLAKNYECLMEFLTLGHMVPNKSEEEDQKCV